MKYNFYDNHGTQYDKIKLKKKHVLMDILLYRKYGLFYGIHNLRRGERVPKLKNK